jgi:hypothetical protein
MCVVAMGQARSNTSGMPTMSAGSVLMNQASTSEMTVPPPSYMLPQHQAPLPMTTRPQDEKEQKNNALQILKMLCETPLLQAYLLDLLKARLEFPVMFT